MATDNWYRKYTLPNPQYEVHIHEMRISVSCSVIRVGDYHTMQHITFQKTSSNWNDLVGLFEDKARKAYAAPLRHKSVSIERIKRGF